AGPGGFDHAAVHESRGRIYVAHTANDAVDVIDIEAQKYVDSIPGLPAVAGAFVAPDLDTVYTSNRGEIAVGVRPNGLAYDPGRRRLLVAHVGDPAIPRSCTVSILDLATGRRVADLEVPGRTRWAVYDPAAD